MLHVDITNAFQMMSYANVEKHLNRNEHLNLNLENKTPHLLLLASPKIPAAVLPK